jgi:hypothetical protein
VKLSTHLDFHNQELVMEKATVDALAKRMNKVERENRRWRCIACVSALGLVLSISLGGFLGSRAVVAQQAEGKAGVPAARPTEYKVISGVNLSQLDVPVRDLAAAGWEVVQVVPTSWTTTGQGQQQSQGLGSVIGRRPMAPGK